MENPSDELERLVGVAQSVSMSQEEHFSVNLGGQRLFVKDDTTLLFQLVVGPDVVVACEVVYFDAHIRQFRQFA